MTLHPRQIEPIPEETARVARAALGRKHPYLRMRDEFESFYQDRDFTSLYPTAGQPAFSPWRLALVTVLQFAEGLSDAQAAGAVKSRIDWKYLLSLELTDAGFDASILSDFRTRLVAHQAQRQLLTGLLTRFTQAGLLKARGKQRTDSTHVLASIRVLNRLELVGETLRAALEATALVAPAWLRAIAQPDWVERYGVRLEEYRLPKGAAERQDLAETIGADGRYLLAALEEEGAPSALRDLPAARALHQIWMQEYDQTGRWRRTEELPPGAQLQVSPYEEEARWGEKRGRVWAGCKAHLTETCEDDLPVLITDVQTTHAAVPDTQVVEAIHTALDREQLVPDRHFLDAGYPTANHLVHSRRQYGITLVGPMEPDTSWQARAGQGFAAADFTLDWDQEVAICPQGERSGRWRRRMRDGKESIAVKFPVAACRSCPVRGSCTRSATAPRTLTLLPQEQALALQAARACQQTEGFRQEYKRRAGIEGTISQAVRRAGLRQARYRGQAKVHLEHVSIAAGLDFVRVACWLCQTPRRSTRTSHLTQVLARAA